MKALLVFENLRGSLVEASEELVAFAAELDAEPVGVLVGHEDALPRWDGKLYLADAEAFGEYNPSAHRRAILDVIAKESPDYVVFSHSSYGWDLAPRVAAALEAGQISEIVGVEDGSLAVDCCNAKLRRLVRPATSPAVLTVQAGAFAAEMGEAVPQVEKITSVEEDGSIEFVEYLEAETGGVDLSKAEIIVAAGRGIGKKENIELAETLAKALGGELGASRPVVDAGWVDHGLQVGSTGQTVSPKLYVALGVSGAIQHLAGMRNSDFVVAVNTDPEAPIAEVADVLVVADVNEFAPAMAEKLAG